MKLFMSFLAPYRAGKAALNCLAESCCDKTWKRRRTGLLSRLALGICCLSMISFPCKLPAQSQWSFYPLQMGNFWRYQITIHGGIYGYNREAIVDSFMIEGEWFRKKRLQEYTGGEGFTYLRQQDSTFITERPGLGQYAPFRRVYKIDAHDGETWLVEISPDDSSRKEWARLDSTAQVTIFGRKRASKHYRFLREHNGELQSTNFRILVDSLGLVQIRGGDGGVDFDDVDLVGAVINGVTYGDPGNEFCEKPSPWPFYPLHHANVWRYQISNKGGGIWGYNLETIVDSLQLEGKCFWEKRLIEYTGGKSFTYMRQQDSTFVQEMTGPNRGFSTRDMFKIKAEVGETWIVEASADSQFKFLGKLEANDSTEVFGKQRKTKRYRFRRETNGHLGSEWFVTLAEGLGMVTLRGGDGGVELQSMDLAGAIINNVVYGDPVSVKENNEAMPRPEIFLMNYPNPFSAVTQIEVNAKSPLNAQLLHVTVYNLNGQKVRSIYHGLFSTSQPFRTMWNGYNDFGRRLPSGVYFIQARLGRQVQTKQIIFLQ